jgi:CBS domain containing-hemolysin-like protein
VDTLGGLVYSRLGRVPQQGDEVDDGGARLIVDEVEGNRINKVRIITAQPAAPVDRNPNGGQSESDD